MLFWQHKSTHNQLVAWLKLGSIVSLVHVIFLIVLFFIYQDGISNLSFIIAAQAMRRDIVFSVVVEKIPKKTMAPKSHQKKPAIAKTAITPAPKKAKTPSLSPVKKEKITPPVSPKKEPVQSVAPKEPEHLDMHVAANKPLHGFEQECADLFQDLTSYWAPPPGVPADAACKITILVDREGALADMNIDTSSGMLVYDLAARAAISELAFPRFTWGKSITITFTV